MTSAELTETTLGGPIGAASAVTGPGLMWGLYSVTKTNAGDYVIFGDFTKVELALARNDTAGADDPATIDGSTTNKVTLSTGTGATIVFVVGTPST